MTPRYTDFSWHEQSIIDMFREFDIKQPPLENYLPDPNSGIFFNDDDSLVSGVLLTLPTMDIRELWIKKSFGDFRFFMEGNNFLDRLSRFECLMRTKTNGIWCPTLRLIGDYDVVFEDGRHRFYWHVIQGFKDIPCAVHPDKVPIYRKLFNL